VSLRARATRHAPRATRHAPRATRHAVDDVSITRINYGISLAIYFRHGFMNRDATKTPGRIRVVVATTVMLSFISFWRAAAIVLNDLGSSAFYAGGIADLPSILITRNAIVPSAARSNLRSAYALPTMSAPPDILMSRLVNWNAAR
jgi:hypothetical protein